MKINQLYQELNRELRNRGEVEMSWDGFQATLIGMAARGSFIMIGDEVYLNSPTPAASSGELNKARPGKGAGPGCAGYAFSSKGIKRR